MGNVCPLSFPSQHHKKLLIWYREVKWKLLSRVRLFVTLWTEEYQAPLSMRASLVAQRLKRLPAMRETWVWSLGWEDPLEKEMATHSSILAWKIPWTEEPGGLQSTGSQRVRHDWVTSLWLSFCPWNSPGQNTGVSSHSLLQEIFPTQGLNPVLPHYRQILYHLSHQGNPNMVQLDGKY